MYSCLPLNSVGNQTRTCRSSVPVPWTAQCCGALHAQVNRLEIGGTVVVIQYTGGTTGTISVTRPPTQRKGPGGRPRRTDRRDPSVLFLIPMLPDTIRSPLCPVGITRGGSVIVQHKLRNLCSGSRGRRAREPAAGGGRGADSDRERLRACR